MQAVGWGGGVGCSRITVDAAVVMGQPDQVGPIQLLHEPGGCYSLWSVSSRARPRPDNRQPDPSLSRLDLEQM